ncbi:hypothetical protein F0U60_05370 [Archangium minus]|uniref:LysR substrate-binding domain-containing protein n=1 Tax=Archangium minus TaxID=83450 RepID=A0ABY9WKB9_9BACT|nr:hypothetical protein F0U60_05370 [Archangium minus]
MLPRVTVRWTHGGEGGSREGRRRDADGAARAKRPAESIERDMVQVRLSRPSRFVVVAAPAYLARRGTPEQPDDLLAHDCIRAPTRGGRYAWELERGKKSWRVPVQGRSGPMIGPARG